MKKIVIAGGTGFIGSYLQKRFREEGFEVLIISRGNEYINWDDEQALLRALEGTEALINLAGKSVDCRYNEKNKALILNSRVDTTRKLQSIIEKCITPPKTWINAGTATIYRHAEDRPMDEYTGEIGSGFSVDVAKAWEKAFFEKKGANTRKVALRIAITIGKGGGVISPFINLVKYGLGGRQGNGLQMFSWVHIEDLYRVIRYLMANENMNGVYNCSAPHPVTNSAFMKEMRSILKPLFHLPSPKFLLQLGAYVINTETELILKSRWVIPKKLEDAGFLFLYPTVNKALRSILVKD
ncbi:MAG TPA: TIGR01777 family oxidoreductase [Ferruginibacter sp.]|nr:TIGR01777 family oxidoreductase [Ferruginibacter sp.]